MTLAVHARYSKFGDLSNLKLAFQIIYFLPVYQGGMASSGDYERFFEIDGKRYCHLLNARTGLPVEYWASVTVIAPSCLLAGTLSSIAMLKQESGEDWLRSQEVNALLIRPDLSLLSLTDR
tara:strand:- start:506 stop:868 length:363 start_codon:yes stop_codon:yes gene_type:complete